MQWIFSKSTCKALSSQAFKIQHTARCYSVNPATSLHWASWSDEYVVFDEGSGQTHQMDSVRAFVLDRLCDGLQSPDSLAAELASIPALADTSDLTQLVISILDEFCVHGLAEVAHA